MGVAILVGVAKYPPFSGLTDLLYPLDDLDSVARELSRQGYLIVSLKNGEATRTRILDAIDQSIAPLQGHGTLIFFFSGHGFADGGVNYLAAHDALGEQLGNTGLAVPAVIQAMKTTGATRQIVWIDACRTGATKGIPRTFVAFSLMSGLHMLLSTQPGKASFEDDHLKHGVFSYYLARALRGEAAEPDGKITFNGVASFVCAGVRSRGEKTGHLQVPAVINDATGDFLIAHASNALFARQEPSGSDRYTPFLGSWAADIFPLKQTKGSCEMTETTDMELKFVAEDVHDASIKGSYHLTKTGAFTPLGCGLLWQNRSPSYQWEGVWTWLVEYVGLEAYRVSSSAGRCIGDCTVAPPDFFSTPYESAIHMDTRAQIRVTMNGSDVVFRRASN
jgi:hypothetical protein